MGIQLSSGNSFVDLWITQDQQGQLAYNKGNYASAAVLFNGPIKVGLMHYFNKDFASAAEQFQSTESDEALFNLANAFAHASNYLYSVAVYDLLLERIPDHDSALKNRAIVQRIVDEMLALGEHQQQEGGDRKQSQQMENPSDEDINVEDMDFGEREPQEQLTADDLLNDPEMAEMWMRQVQSNPADFLSIKFQMQLKSE